MVHFKVNLLEKVTDLLIKVVDAIKLFEINGFHAVTLHGS